MSSAVDPRTTESAKHFYVKLVILLKNMIK